MEPAEAHCLGLGAEIGLLGQVPGEPLVLGHGHEAVQMLHDPVPTRGPRSLR